MVKDTLSISMTSSQRPQETFGPTFVAKFLRTQLREPTLFCKFLRTLPGERIMGQILRYMRRRYQDWLVYDMVFKGDVEAIKTLHREGASLERIDNLGRTPLLVACMNPEMAGVAKTLIKLGADVNAYCPGSPADTLLHFAVKGGLEQTVAELLSHGANAWLKNDDCQTPLDIARTKGYANIVRIIKNKVCYFSGWLREFCGPGFLEPSGPQLLSRRSWVVVLPFGPDSDQRGYLMNLFIYSNFQDAWPRSVIVLRTDKIVETKFQQTDPAFIVSDEHSGTRYKLGSDNKDDRKQLRWLYNACKGNTTEMLSREHHMRQSLTGAAASKTIAEAVKSAMARAVPVQSATADAQVPLITRRTSEPFNTNGWGGSSGNADHNRWSVPDSGPLGQPTQHVQTNNFVPSAPPIPEEGLDEGSTYNPFFDFSQVECSIPPREYGASIVNDMTDEGNSSSCIICFEAPLEAACVPCGHQMACMTCLKEIEAKSGVCPVCLVMIDQVIYIYVVR